MIQEKSSLIMPFKCCDDILNTISRFSDVVVISSAPEKTINYEWEKYNLKKYTTMLMGCESGCKEQCILKLIKMGYSKNHIIMIGDAIGDKSAAESNNVEFYPIIFNNEICSWNEFVQVGLKKFISENYLEYSCNRTNLFFKKNSDFVNYGI